MAWELFCSSADDDGSDNASVWCFGCCCSWCLIWHLASLDMNFLQESTCWQADSKNEKKRIVIHVRFIFATCIFQCDLNKCVRILWLLLWCSVTSQCAIDFIVATDAIVVDDSDNDDGCSAWICFSDCLFISLFSAARISMLKILS